MNHEYRSFGTWEKADARKHETSKIEFRGQTLVPSNVIRYTVEERLFGDAVGRVFLATGEVFTFKCPKDEFLSAFGRRR